MKNKGISKTALLLVMTLALIFTFATPNYAMAATQKPAQVTNVKVTSYDYNKVKIAWPKTKNAQKYRVYQATSKNGKYKSIVTTSNRTFIKGNLVTGKTYYYKVRGINGKKLGALSVSKAVKPKLRTVKGLDGNVNSATSLKLTWNKVNGAKGYQIYKATNPSGKYQKIKTTSKLYCVDGGIIKDKPYYYKVRAYTKVSEKYLYGSFSKPMGRKLVIIDKKAPAKIRSEMLKQVNAERKKAGVSPLKAYEPIDYTAQIKAADMYLYGYFNHYSPRLGYFDDQYEAAGLKRIGGENLAWGQRTVTEAMDAWMLSKGHKENILRKEFTHLGVGYVNGFWVQQFYVIY